MQQRGMATGPRRRGRSGRGRLRRSASARYVFVDGSLDRSHETPLAVRSVRNAARKHRELRDHLILEEGIRFTDAELLESELRELAQASARRRGDSAQGDRIGRDSPSLPRATRRFAQRPEWSDGHDERPGRVLMPCVDDAPPAQRAQKPYDRLTDDRFPVPAVDASPRDYEQLVRLGHLPLAKPRLATRFSILGPGQRRAQVQRSLASEARFIERAVQRNDAVATRPPLATFGHCRLPKRVP